MLVFVALFGMGRGGGEGKVGGLRGSEEEEVDGGTYMTVTA